MSTGYVGNVCDTQDKFNDAYRQALQNDQEKRMEENKDWVTIYGMLWLVSMVWAVLLAMKAPEASRIQHLVLALVFSPLYVLAYYINALSLDKSSGSK